MYNVSIVYLISNFLHLIFALKVGGVKEKILAAYNSNIKTIIIPDLNMKDLKKIPNNIRVSILKIFIAFNLLKS